MKHYRSKAAKRKPRVLLDNDDDPFFESDPKRRRRGEDEEIEGVSSDDDREVSEEEKEEAPEETADEVRYRIAKEYLQKVRALTQRDEDEGNEEEGREDKDGRRDSLVAEKLLKDQLQDSGRIRRLIASR